MGLTIYPHILLKRGDIVIIPGGNINHAVEVVDLVDGRLLCTARNNRFILSWGFYYKDEFGYYRPIIN